MTQKLVVQLARFAASGVANTGLGLAAIYLAMALGVQYVVANALGYAIGLVISFLINRNWTFQRKVGDAHREILPFLLLALAAYLANLAAVVSLVELAGAPAIMAQLVGVGVYAICSFLGMKYLVFPTDRSPDQ